MNLFGFLATCVISAASITSVCLLCKYGITYRKVTADITKPCISEKKDIQSDKKEDKAEVVHMDAVIQAANALMGINIDDSKGGR